MRQSIIILFLIFFQFISLKANDVDSLLLVLETTMNNRSNYDKNKEDKIKNIKDLLIDTSLNQEEIYHLNNQIINEFEKYNFDSTLSYILRNLTIAEKLKNDFLHIETSLILCDLLSSSGRYKEAIDILNDIKKKKPPTELQIAYLTQLKKAYENLGYHTSLIKKSQEYLKLSKLFSDSLLLILDQNTEEAYELKEVRFRMAGHLMESKKINTHRLAMSEMGTAIYSMVTYNRSQIYQEELNTELQKKFLILSAISDIKASIKDNASLTSLALILYHEGEIKKAYDYINFSMEDALFFNSSLRFIELSNILPLITEAYQIKSDKQKSNLRKSIIIISSLLFILILAFVYIFIQMRNLSRTRNDLRNVNKQLKSLNNELNNSNYQLNCVNLELTESNHIKEQYIGNFLKICSNYIDKLNSYRIMVNKQIANKKVAELFELTKSKTIIDNEIQEFYTTFDHTFLNIYPNFVDELNILLLPEEKIVLKKDEVLNTELRIFALIRLGIVDSSKIAKLLRYSVNTIYNYRVKVKNKAAGDRDNFEDLVMKIDTCSKPIDSNK